MASAHIICYNMLVVDTYCIAIAKFYILDHFNLEIHIYQHFTLTESNIQAISAYFFEF